ncbi:histidine kinase [Shewanella carassii]|uniref:sensor histidine kinase n=1 Tax=Shewanella carassii TaxID=1987584 RepID=UPI001BEDAB1C|nr:histidine kinase [Shewanella carassii]
MKKVLLGMDGLFGRTGGLAAADQLALLRGLGLILQLGLTLFGSDAFGLTPQPEPLTWILGLESAYLALTLWLRHPLYRQSAGIFIALLLDTLFWISWLWFSGGATNAFISLLLVPIALAAVTLPAWGSWSLAVLSTLAYSLMILSLPEGHVRHHGMDMSSHFLGMWLNFVVSALVLTTSVALISRRLRRQDTELGWLRENQLRQEQLLALGTASAQMAHQLATPLASLRLLLDEVMEEGADREALEQMGQALARCEVTLNELRNATESIRERRRQLISLDDLGHNMRQQLMLLMPEVDFSLTLPAGLTEREIITDASLLPALLALVDNAAKASLGNINVPKVEIGFEAATETQLEIRIKDYGRGIEAHLLGELGLMPVASRTGMGVAVLLSHASLERLGGQLILQNGPQGCEARVSLPLQPLAATVGKPA